MHQYKVGAPYRPDHIIWQKIPQFNCCGEECELALFMDSPTDCEVAAVEKGESEFAFYADVYDDVILFCYHFGPCEGYSKSITWCDAPYSYHLVPEPERIPAPDPQAHSPAARVILHIVLVNAKGGEIRALRAVYLSPEFTKALYEAITRQAARSFNSVRFDSRVRSIYARHSSTAALARVCRYTTKGED
jgi:hypothetical protein